MVDITTTPAPLGVLEHQRSARKRRHQSVTHNGKQRKYFAAAKLEKPRLLEVAAPESGAGPIEGHDGVRQLKGENPYREEAVPVNCEKQRCSGKELLVPPGNHHPAVTLPAKKTAFPQFPTFGSGATSTTSSREQCGGALQWFEHSSCRDSLSPAVAIAGKVSEHSVLEDPHEHPSSRCGSLNSLGLTDQIGSQNRRQTPPRRGVSDSVSVSEGLTSDGSFADAKDDSEVCTPPRPQRRGRRSYEDCIPPTPDAPRRRMPGGMPLYNAIVKHDRHAVTAALKRGEDPNGLLLYRDPDTRNFESRTRSKAPSQYHPLLLAAKLSTPGVIHNLIKGGAVTNALNAEGQNALHVLCCSQPSSSTPVQTLEPDRSPAAPCGNTGTGSASKDGAAAHPPVLCVGIRASLPQPPPRIHSGDPVLREQWLEAVWQSMHQYSLLCADPDRAAIGPSGSLGVGLSDADDGDGDTATKWSNRAYSTAANYTTWIDDASSECGDGEPKSGGLTPPRDTPDAAPPPEENVQLTIPSRRAPPSMTYIDRSIFREEELALSADILLLNGICTQRKDAHGKTPADYARANGHYGVLAVICQAEDRLRRQVFNRLICEKGLSHRGVQHRGTPHEQRHFDRQGSQPLCASVPAAAAADCSCTTRRTERGDERLAAEELMTGKTAIRSVDWEAAPLDAAPTKLSVSVDSELINGNVYGSTSVRTPSPKGRRWRYDSMEASDEPVRKERTLKADVDPDDCEGEAELHKAVDACSNSAGSSPGKHLLCKASARPTCEDCFSTPSTRAPDSVAKEDIQQFLHEWILPHRERARHLVSAADFIGASKERSLFLLSRWKTASPLPAVHESATASASATRPVAAACVITAATGLAATQVGCDARGC